MNLNHGTYHWITQRLSSLLLIPLTIMFGLSFVRQIGLGYEQNVLFYQNPLRAFLVFLFVSVTLFHLRQGIEVVIEDYIHNYTRHRILLKANVMFFWIMNLLICFALGKIVYG